MRILDRRIYWQIYSKKTNVSIIICKKPLRKRKWIKQYETVVKDYDKSILVPQKGEGIGEVSILDALSVTKEIVASIFYYREVYTMECICLELKDVERAAYYAELKISGFPMSSKAFMFWHYILVSWKERLRSKTKYKIEFYKMFV